MHHEDIINLFWLKPEGERGTMLSNSEKILVAKDTAYSWGS